MLLDRRADIAQPCARADLADALPHRLLRDADQPPRAGRFADHIGLAGSAMKPFFSSVIFRLTMSPSRITSSALGTPWQTTWLIELLST
jgi:hypothetical protein